MKVALAPSLEKFVSRKIKAGAYLDVSDVSRENLRRWRDHEETGEWHPMDWRKRFRKGSTAPI